jgi:hypothetical protein
MNGSLHRGRHSVSLQDRGLPRLRDSSETLFEIQPVEHGATMESAATEREHLLDLTEREARCAPRIVAVDVRAVLRIGGWVWHAWRRAATTPHCTAGHRPSTDESNAFTA